MSTSSFDSAGLKTNLGVFQTPSDHGKMESDTTTTTPTTRGWFGSHPTSHHAYLILVVGSPNRGRVGEKGDQNLGQRNPQTGGSCCQNHRLMQSSRGRRKRETSRATGQTSHSRPIKNSRTLRGSFDPSPLRCRKRRDDHDVEPHPAAVRQNLQRGGVISFLA